MVRQPDDAHSKQLKLQFDSMEAEFTTEMDAKVTSSTAWHAHTATESCMVRHQMAVLASLEAAVQHALRQKKSASNATAKGRRRRRAANRTKRKTAVVAPIADPNSPTTPSPKDEVRRVAPK